MDSTPNLDIAAARYVVGTATPEETQALAESAGGDATVSSIEELGVPLPSEDQAVWMLLELHVGAIAHGSDEPEEGLRHVIDEVYRPAGLSAKSRAHPGDSHDIDRLLALQDEYDDMRAYERRTGTPDRRKALVPAQVTLAAREWMARNATYRVQ